MTQTLRAVTEICSLLVFLCTYIYMLSDLIMFGLIWQQTSVEMLSVEITKIYLRLVFLEKLLRDQYLVCLVPSTVTIIFRVANHRITEYGELEGTQEDHWVPALHRTTPKNHTMSSAVLSKHFLNSDMLALWSLPCESCSSGQTSSG